MMLTRKANEATFYSLKELEKYFKEKNIKENS